MLIGGLERIKGDPPWYQSALIFTVKGMARIFACGNKAISSVSSKEELNVPENHTLVLIPQKKNLYASALTTPICVSW